MSDRIKLNRKSYAVGPLATERLQGGGFRYPSLKVMTCGCIGGNSQAAISDGVIHLSQVTARKMRGEFLACFNASEQKLERAQARIDVKKNDWPVIAGKMISFFHNRINASQCRI